jgi:hypothetical protein
MIPFFISLIFVGIFLWEIYPTGLIEKLNADEYSRVPVGYLERIRDMRCRF